MFDEDTGRIQWINLNVWMLRANSRWSWMASEDARKDAGVPLLIALDVAHPIFSGYYR